MLQAAHRIATRHGVSIAAVSLRWVLEQPGITSAILGVTRLEHLQSALAVLDQPPLTPETLAACDEVYLPLRGIAPTYNR